MTDIYDLKPFIHPSHFIFWILLILVALVLFLLVFFVWKKTGARFGRKTVSKLSPSERFFFYLDQLKVNSSSSEDEKRIFCFSLSAILRRYLEEKWFLSALETTTEEFSKVLKTEKCFEEKEKESLLKFFKIFDAVKFAKQTFRVEELNQLLMEVRQTVVRVEGKKDVSSE